MVKKVQLFLKLVSYVKRKKLIHHAALALCVYGQQSIHLAKTEQTEAYFHLYYLSPLSLDILYQCARILKQTGSLMTIIANSPKACTAAQRPELPMDTADGVFRLHLMGCQDG